MSTRSSGSLIRNRKQEIVFNLIFPNPKRSLYLNLHDYFSAQEKKTTPYTQSVQCMYALCEALDEYMENGGLGQAEPFIKKGLILVEDFLKDLGIPTLLKKKRCPVCCVHLKYQIILPTNKFMIILRKRVL